jgi:hypothetical protein
MEALARVRERATPDLAPVTPAWGLPVDSGQPQEPQAVVPGDWTAEPVEEDQRTIQSVVASAEGPFAPPPPPVDRP